MSEFQDRLAAARAAARTHFKDVPVLLDAAVSEERARLEAELETADNDQRLGSLSQAEQIEQQLAELADASKGSLVTLRLTRLPGRDWATLTSKCPPRPEVPVDRHYGYNYDAVCEAAARYVDPQKLEYGQRLEDGEPVSLTDDDWSELFSLLAGSDIEKIRDAIWALNEYEPEQRRQALVKGSGAATRSASK